MTEIQVYFSPTFPAQENLHTVSDTLNFLASKPWPQMPNSLEQEGAAILSGFQRGEISPSLFHNCSLKAYNFLPSCSSAGSDAQTSRTSSSGRKEN